MVQYEELNNSFGFQVFSVNEDSNDLFWMEKVIHNAFGALICLPY